MRGFRRTGGRSGPDRSPAERPALPDEVSRVLVVGAGTMGQQIGFQCAGQGIDVLLYDVSPSVLEAAQARIAAYADRLIADWDVFNAMYTAVNREAITMAEQGVASIEDIDRAWMHVTKWPHGPVWGLRPDRAGYRMADH